MAGVNVDVFAVIRQLPGMAGEIVGVTLEGDNVEEKRTVTAECAYSR
jgi:hypothetical protein